MRILGVDFGGTRTGLALSDPLGITCSPLGTIREKDENLLVEKIVVVVREQEVGTIVVGLPRPLKGGTNAQSRAAVSFKEHLEHEAPVPVTMWDERFTSRLADARRSRGSEQDAVAACYMLQGFLDSRAQPTEDS
jgi:putative holliday junction resolvase